MARKIARVTIVDDKPNRDLGKTFILTEMSAYQAEHWAARVLFALMNGGAEIPEEIASAGMAGIAAIGIKALGNLPYATAKPLLDEMFDCVTLDCGKNITRALIDDDIEEVSTRLKIRTELLKLHIDFFMNAAPSIQE